jgi:hypothetical protein
MGDGRILSSEAERGRRGSPAPQCRADWQRVTAATREELVQHCPDRRYICRRSDLLAASSGLLGAMEWGVPGCVQVGFGGSSTFVSKSAPSVFTELTRSLTSHISIRSAGKLVRSGNSFSERDSFGSSHAPNCPSLKMAGRFNFCLVLASVRVSGGGRR